MEQENEEKEARNAVEASAEAPSENKTPKSLKASSKIEKKSVVKDLKSEKSKLSSRAWRRAGKKKKQNLSDERKDRSTIIEEGSKKHSPREGNLKESPSKQKDTKTGQLSQKNQDEVGRSDKSHQKHRGKDKNSVSDTSLRNQKYKEKQRDTGEGQEKEKKKEKLGGLIFMCSKKTKPDCFHYRVMGVSAGKKDLVMAIKPGLKLFLFDFDLKLMYGIYKASSSGGMKLEPKAFGGGFPAQVRFNVHRDCLPLPESVFKKAIKENYDEKNKFKIELTPRQVRKLSELFRPASLHSTALPVQTPSLPKLQDGKVYAGSRESNRESFARDPYANVISRSYNRLSLERDQHITYGKVGSSLGEEVPCNIYLTEKEYRTYGLHRERKNLTTNHITARLDPYQRVHEQGQRHLLKHLDPIYVDAVPASREPVLADPLYLTERKYQSYNVSARHELLSRVSPVAAAITATATTLDSYPSEPYNTYYYGASSVDQYLPPPRREDINSGPYSVAGRRETYLGGTDPLRGGETDPADRLYSSYAANALSHYNRHYNEPKLEAEAAPVTSRYSFAGPLLSYR